VSKSIQSWSPSWRFTKLGDPVRARFGSWHALNHDKGIGEGDDRTLIPYTRLLVKVYKVGVRPGDLPKLATQFVPVLDPGHALNHDKGIGEGDDRTLIAYTRLLVKVYKVGVRPGDLPKLATSSCPNGIGVVDCPVSP
jgi:hypothetical protein